MSSLHTLALLLEIDFLLDDCLCGNKKVDISLKKPRKTITFGISVTPLHSVDS